MKVIFLKGYYISHFFFHLVEEFPRKESLPPPPASRLTWADYISSCECPLLGRPLVCKESSKSFKATIAMSEDFPLTVEMLLSVLEVKTRQI
jgi:hypothetical protein